MAGREPSRQELIRRRRSVGFIGRQSEADAFREALRQPPEEAAQFLFHIRGPGGVIFNLRSLVAVVPSAGPRIEGFCRVLEAGLAAEPQ
ncbi:hypothetical protein [Streptomyces sp. NPDC058401]|uniref:hypothetical protein n=1 Tax=Streptomyces sp. NPDC058401 TaxID=3346480 RepID=UPI0036609141